MKKLCVFLGEATWASSCWASSSFTQLGLDGAVYQMLNHGHLRAGDAVCHRRSALRAAPLAGDCGLMAGWPARLPGLSTAFLVTTLARHHRAALAEQLRGRIFWCCKGARIAQFPMGDLRRRRR